MSGKKNSNNSWTLHDYKQNATDKLSEVDLYKYLGLILGNSTRNMFGKHLTKMVSRAKQLGGAIRAKAADSWDKVKVANELWNSMACPGIDSFPD